MIVVGCHLVDTTIVEISDLGSDDIRQNNADVHIGDNKSST